MILRDIPAAENGIGAACPTDHLGVASRLSAIDWSFRHRSRAFAIESIHPYPAKFIGEIPRALMAALPIPKNTIVLDPFSGSGATLVEAQRLGLSSIGVDLNPIACLIARVKTSTLPLALSETARRIVLAARKNKKPHRWIIPNLNHWFKVEVQEAIATLLHEIAKLDGTASYDTLRLALSSILVRVSNQESDTRYAAIDKRVVSEDVYVSFLTAVEKVSKALSARNWSLPPAKIIEANTLTLEPGAIEGSVGLVITSPPYPNAYEYWLYHKYRMWWLGFDPLAVKAHEIGARAHFFKRERHTKEHFSDQMRFTFALIDQVLVKDGYACFVIGRSKIHGEIIDNANIVQTAAAAVGFTLVTRFDRVIAANRKSFNLSHANIKKETVLILQKHRA